MCCYVTGEYGHRRPFYFCFMPSYWCGRKLEASILADARYQNDISINLNLGSGDQEGVSNEMAAKEALRSVAYKAI